MQASAETPTSGQTTAPETATGESTATAATVTSYGHDWTGPPRESPSATLADEIRQEDYGQGGTVSTATAAAAYTGVFRGTADQLSQVRRQVARHLADRPVTGDAVLIASEIAANAITHSRSRGESFTIRVELHPDHCRIECHDAGGPWRPGRHDGRAHGLANVAALTGPDGWGTQTTGDGGRIVWARLSW